MKVDLHNHTHFCNHATGSMEEYVLKAIEHEIYFFGFSEHAPMYFDPDYRVSFEQMDAYKKEVLYLKEKYKEHISILFAYEVDYLPGYMDDRVLNAQVDYLIGSVHFLNGWGFDNPEFIGSYKYKDIDTIWQNYFNQIEAMAKSKLFDIVGHIDLIKIFKFFPTKNIMSIAEASLHAIKESGMSIEINAAGFDKPVSEAYPSKQLLKKAYELNIPITFGSDAHSPKEVNRHNSKIVALAKSVGYEKATIHINRTPKMVKF